MAPPTVERARLIAEVLAFVRSAQSCQASLALPS